MGSTIDLSASVVSPFRKPSGMSKASSHTLLIMPDKACWEALLPHIPETVLIADFGNATCIHEQLRMRPQQVHDAVFSQALTVSSP